MKRCFFDDLENKKIIKNNGTLLPKISTDTRTISLGDFYIPLKGENFDGEKFIEPAVASGAVGFVTTSEDNANAYINDSRVKMIAVVPDTKLAYMELAAARIKKLGVKVVGITGSSGKTTVKEMIYSVLSQAFKTHKTSLNHNNEIGFCQTVFEAPEDTEVLVLEMGMRGFGEIELIAKYANLSVGVVTNVGTAHIGRLGSRENIALAKCEISKFLPEDGFFIAHDDELIKNVIKFSGEKSFYSIKDVEITSQEIGKTSFEYLGFDYTIPIEGLHNVENALSAILIGRKLGMNESQINQGLLAYHTIENRWNVDSVGRFKIINDCYNANPESMKATINTILTLYPNPTLILGDMGELGDESEKYHLEVGEFINSHKAKNGKIILITVGTFAKKIFETVDCLDKQHFETVEKVSDYILKNNNIGNILFFKASRSMKFERIIEKLKGDF